MEKLVLLTSSDDGEFEHRLVDCPSGELADPGSKFGQEIKSQELSFVGVANVPLGVRLTGGEYFVTGIFYGRSADKTFALSVNILDGTILDSTALRMIEGISLGLIKNTVRLVRRRAADRARADPRRDHR